MMTTERDNFCLGFPFFASGEKNNELHLSAFIKK